MNPVLELAKICIEELGIITGMFLAWFNSSKVKYNDFYRESFDCRQSWVPKLVVSYVFYQIFGF